MKTFVLNLTKMIETNPRIYASIIAGLVSCLLLLIAEAIHIQNIVTMVASQDQEQLGKVIRPLAQRYDWTRYLILVISIVWCVYEYKSTKKRLGF